MNEKIFEPILDKNETIIKVFKPNKTKLFLSAYIIAFFPALFVIMTIFAAVGQTGIYGTGNALVPIVILGAFLVVYLILRGFVTLYYNKLFYAYSNKRIIIRTGIFGVDYKSLDMSMIGAVNVNVSLLDKMLNKNTGSIRFGSMASPMVSANGEAGNPYRFANILAPYDTYRELKDVIDEYKELKANKK